MKLVSLSFDLKTCKILSDYLVTLFVADANMSTWLCNLDIVILFHKLVSLECISRSMTLWLYKYK